MNTRNEMYLTFGFKECDFETHSQRLEFHKSVHYIWSFIFLVCTIFVMIPTASVCPDSRIVILPKARKSAYSSMQIALETSTSITAV